MSGHWTQAVEAALNDEQDFDEVWEGLGQAIEQAPADAGLLHLRIRLAEEAGQPRQLVADLQALARLVPDDADVALELALRQHRWAWLLQDDDGEEGDEEGEEPDDPAEDAPPSPADTLREQSLQTLLALSERSGHDAGFFQRLLDGWDERIVGQPWQQLVAALRANAAHPGTAALQRHLWRCWLSVVDLNADFELPEGQVPVGFCVDVFGQTHDALAARRALQALDEALARDPDDAEALTARARLRVGLSRLAEAAADHTRAAAAWEARGEADEAAEARRQAALCSQGRAALGSAWSEDLGASVDRIGQFADTDAEARPELAAFLADMREQSRQTQAALREQLEALQAQLLTPPDEPDDAARAELAAQAERVAGQLGGALAFTPAVWVAHAPARVSATLDPRLRAFDEQMQALGIPHVGWAENPAYSAMFGTQALTGMWRHPSGEAMVLCSAAGRVQAIELETELSDGRQIVTTLSRGRNFFGGGPQVDTLHADASLPLPDWLALHRARVALVLAQSPGLALRPWSDMADFAAAQERQRQAKMAHRLAHGLDEFEALGVPSEWPEVFVPMMQAAAKAFVARAAAAR